MKIKDYYSILAVSRDATDEEIKKSYRRLALRYHPDSNENGTETEDRIKEINEAYSILSDQKKRRYYDTYGTADFDKTGPSNNPYDYFQNAFQGRFKCRGMGLGRAFGRRGCGMGKFFRNT